MINVSDPHPEDEEGEPDPLTFTLQDGTVLKVDFHDPGTCVVSVVGYGGEDSHGPDRAGVYFDPKPAELRELASWLTALAGMLDEDARREQGGTA